MKALLSIWDFLKGKKTYLVAILMIILSGLKAQGYIDQGTYQVILGILASLGLTALRLGMSGK